MRTLICCGPNLAAGHGLVIALVRALGKADAVNAPVIALQREVTDADENRQETRIPAKCVCGACSLFKPASPNVAAHRYQVP